MKILLIHTKDEGETASRLQSLLGNMNILSESFPLTSSDVDIKQFTAFFGPEKKGDVQLTESQRTESQRTESPSHAVILSSLSRQYSDFLAGFSYGSHLPFLVYGQDAVSGISKEFASCFTFMNTEDALLKYLEAEYEVFKKQETAREIIKAQDTLLKIGVPINGESLAKCVSEGRIQEVSYFLAAGFSPNTRNNAGVPLINIATRTGNREVIRFLVMAGAEMDLQADDRGSSALIDSVMGKQYEIMRDLIKAGANLDITSKDGQTALVVAVGASDERMVEALLKAGADPDICDHMGVSARKYASLFHKSSITSLFDTYAPKKEVQQ